MREHKSHLDGRMAQWARAITRGRAPHMRALYVRAFVLAVVLTVTVMVVLSMGLSTQRRIGQTNEAHHSCQMAVDELQSTSDFLTSESRQFVTTGERIHMDAYLAEVKTSDRRGRALRTLRSYATNDEAVAALESAREQSEELSKIELYALHLKADALHMGDVPPMVESAALSEEDASLTDADKAARAIEMLTDMDYAHMKLEISEHVQDCSRLLVESLQDELDEENAHLSVLMLVLRICVVLILLTLGFVIVTTVLFLLWPISTFEPSILDDKPLEMQGARELHSLICAYNDMYEKNHEREESLTFEARYDALTGVLNRGSFEELLTRHKENSALMLVDVDNFKGFNDKYGHDMGDAILIEVSATLYASFRSTDHICRIGGDEFAVIMTDAHPGLEDVIGHKMRKVSSFLRDTSNGLPAATISVGIAFGYEGCADDVLFQLADEALYEVKRGGRDGFAFAKQDEE